MWAGASVALRSLKRLLRVERIRLDEHTLEIELPKQLLVHSSFVVLAGRVAGLSDCHAECSRVERHLGDEG